MTTDAERQEDASKKRKTTWLERLLMFGFITMVVVAAVMYLSGARAVDKAAKQLDRQSVVVGYLNDDNVWDNCNDIKNREFFIATSDVINASIAGDDAAVLKASKKLATIQDELGRIEEPSVCGPPPLPPAEPND